MFPNDLARTLILFITLFLCFLYLLQATAKTNALETLDEGKEDSEEDGEEDEYFCEPCTPDDHDLNRLTIEGDPSYFTVNYLAKRPYYPKECSECKIKYGREYKINPTNKRVFFCKNGKDAWHDCQFGLCEPCYNKKQYDTADGTTPRKESRRSRSKKVRGLSHGVDC